jgi:CubicO group peptidase (beta-lactamase class C family)
MKKIILICLLSVGTIIAHSQPMTSGAIDTLIKRALTAFNVPGIAVGIVKDSTIIYAKGFGVSSIASGNATTAQTVFGIASNSKAFTAAALGILVDEGKLKWDDKVRDYIPEFEMYNPYVTEEFIIRDLLTHRSGLGLGAGDLMLFLDSSDFTLNDILHNLRYLKPVSSFRSKFDYDNNLYVVAGEIIARVSGMSWDDFITKRIFAPLDMTASAPAYELLKEYSNVAAPHAELDGKVVTVQRSNLSICHSAGGIHSNVIDMCKWMSMLLAGGKFGNNPKKQLLSPGVLKEMCSPQTILPVRSGGAYNTHFSAYGLGFFLSDVKGYKQISHTGGLAGMVTQVTMIPELNLGIVVLTNQEAGAAFSAITNQIKDSYFGIRGTDRVAEYATARNNNAVETQKYVDSVWRNVAISIPKGAVTDTRSVYEGTFKDSWFGNVTVSQKDGKLYYASTRSYKMRGQMYYYRGNTFIVKWEDRSMNADAFVNFVLDESGNAKGFTMGAVSPATDFSFDFADLSFEKQ